MKIYYKHAQNSSFQAFILVFLLIYIFCFGFTTPKLFGQISEGDTAKVEFRVAITGNWQTGNILILTQRGKADFLYSPFKNRNIVFKSQNTYLYQEIKNIKVDDFLNSRNFIYFNPHKRIYPFLRLYISENFRLAIDFRYLLGAGITWQVIKKPTHLVKLSGSLAYEQTDFSKNTYNESLYNGFDHINTTRAIMRLYGKHDILPKKLNFHYDVYIQPSVEWADNYRGSAEFGLDIPMWKGLNFTTSYVYGYENIVVTGVKQEDTILTFGFSYNYKKL